MCSTDVKRGGESGDGRKDGGVGVRQETKTKLTLFSRADKGVFKLI